ncbi:MAG TPA: septum formation initiator family protein, partial [Acidimicrobiia bacterium]|nr:septum formation initiator family protein [Acidimicrobiia bacterium]
APPTRTRRRAPSSTPKPASTRRRASQRVRRRRTVLTATLVGRAVAGLLFVVVYPTRTYLQQRNQITAAQHHVAQLHHDTARLEAQSRQLQTDAAVERIAREQYGLVKPGETPYVIVPTAPPATTPTTAAATPPTTTKAAGTHP